MLSFFQHGDIVDEDHQAINLTPIIMRWYAIDVDPIDLTVAGIRFNRPKACGTRANYRQIFLVACGGIIPEGQERHHRAATRLHRLDLHQGLGQCIIINDARFGVEIPDLGVQSAQGLLQLFVDFLQTGHPFGSQQFSFALLHFGNHHTDREHGHRDKTDEEWEKNEVRLSECDQLVHAEVVCR